MLTVRSFIFNPVQENTYLVYNEKKDCCIIDPGCYFASEETELDDFIKENQLTPVLLLNTHCHFDHIFGNSFIHRKYGLVPHLHPDEKQVLDRGPAAAALWQLSYDHYDGEVKFISENDVIRLGDDGLKVLFTPGHSPGSVSFYSPENKFVISGDVLFQGSIGRTDLPGGDFSVLEKSILTVMYSLPADTIVYPGHGDSTTIGDEMKSNPFVKMV